MALDSQAREQRDELVWFSPHLAATANGKRTKRANLRRQGTVGFSVRNGKSSARNSRTSPDVARGLPMRISDFCTTRAELLAIGWNVAELRRDAGNYDLLASEARLASYLVIAHGQAPQRHWFSLGRLLAEPYGEPVLLSWSGSMFEYLMPTLVLRSNPSTLLGQSDRTAVDVQREYGRAHDVHMGCQDQALRRGIRIGTIAIAPAPDLGLRRRLSQDLVVAPYATMLASRGASAALQNLKELTNLGLLDGTDFTSGRLHRTGAC
jgi:cyclic beta-1,2-glucan synthetase